MPRVDSLFDHEVKWPAIKLLAEHQSTDKLLQLLSSPEDVNERLALHRFALRFLAFRPWSPKSLDVVVAVGSAGVREAVSAFESTDEDTSWYREEASQMAYNTATNLAVCWNDDFRRHEQHFRKGLELARFALELRQRLRKGPASMALAWAVKGMHELALKMHDDALQSFELAVMRAEEIQPQNSSDGSATVVGISRIHPGSAYELVLAHGMLVLTRLAQSRDRKWDLAFKQVMQTFEGMKQVSPAAHENAELGIEQLQCLRQFLKL